MGNKMRFGWCHPASDTAMLADTGFDFIELPLAGFGLEDAASLTAAKAMVRDFPLPVGAFNYFMPQDMRVVGPDVDETRVRSYLARAAELMAQTQAGIVVYGSGWARNLCAGLSRARQEEQFLQSLEWAADAVKGTGITVVIEPLNLKESDIATSVDEATGFAKTVNRDEIRVLADFYHMDEEQEPFDTLIRNADWLRHVHLADTGRHHPGSGSYPYAAFFSALKTAGYTGRLSVECKPAGPEDHASALQFLQSAWDAAEVSIR
ncbi:MAG: sugar phosphate isomerase/epimerase family protein [Pseudomonadota bacterium]|nr:sugar phosphate isomerase/epimerase family protein [Pseudomonadota bacterium]